ncbi:hypothetical protein ACU4GR_02500 [Methylobacterium oryzae CBMB20]
MPAWQARSGLGGYLGGPWARRRSGPSSAFVAGLKQLNDPWGGLVDWFHDLRVTQAKYELLRDALDAPARTGRLLIQLKADGSAMAHSHGRDRFGAGRWGRHDRPAHLGDVPASEQTGVGS